MEIEADVLGFEENYQETKFGQQSSEYYTDGISVTTISV